MKIKWGTVFLFTTIASLVWGVNQEKQIFGLKDKVNNYDYAISENLHLQMAEIVQNIDRSEAIISRTLEQKKMDQDEYDALRDGLLAIHYHFKEGQSSLIYSDPWFSKNESSALIYDLTEATLTLCSDTAGISINKEFTENDLQELHDAQTYLRQWQESIRKEFPIAVDSIQNDKLSEYVERFRDIEHWHNVLKQMKKPSKEYQATGVRPGS
jgi:hypothetical protein